MHNIIYHSKTSVWLTSSILSSSKSGVLLLLQLASYIPCCCICRHLPGDTCILNGDLTWFFWKLHDTSLHEACGMSYHQTLQASNSNISVKETLCVVESLMHVLTGYYTSSLPEKSPLSWLYVQHKVSSMHAGSSLEITCIVGLLLVIGVTSSSSTFHCIISANPF